MDPSRKKLLVSLLLGFLAAALGLAYLAVQKQDLLDQSQMVKVLVAARYIPAYTRLDDTWLDTRKIPRAYLSKGTMTKVSDVEGLLCLAPFSQGEPILLNKLAQASQSLAAAIPEGLRAFTISVDSATGINGLVQPGDYVDVLFLSGGGSEGGQSSKSMAATLFQDKRVVAVGSQYSPAAASSSNTPPTASNGGGTITLALSPHECEVALFAQSQGRIQLCLRPTGENNFVELKSAGFSSILAKIQQQKQGSGVEIFRGSGPNSPFGQ